MKKTDWGQVRAWLGLVVILLAVATALFFAVFPTGIWVSNDVAVRALETQGYKDVQVVDKCVWFIVLRGGDSRDAVRFTCTATNPAGQTVKVYVFSGWLFKAATIRTF